VALAPPFIMGSVETWRIGEHTCEAMGLVTY